MELELLRYIQSAASPVLDVFFIGITMLAEPALWVVVLAWIYWNSDKTAGRFISYAMFTSLCFGNGLKEIFRMPRPIGEPGIRTIYADTATGYSFPSGHSQMMATVGSAIPLWYRKNSLWYFFIPLMFLVAFSRMYLGVHYPRDVFVGLLLGVGISWLCAKLWDRALGHSGLFAATFGLMSIFLFVARSHDFLQLYGLFGGFAAGCAYEERYAPWHAGPCFQKSGPVCAGALCDRSGLWSGQAAARSALADPDPVLLCGICGLRTGTDAV